MSNKNAEYVITNLAKARENNAALLSAANAKTGKSDENLTDAVKTLLEGYGQGGDSPLPIEVSTEAEMTDLLETAEIGSVYKYTGETDTYENGALYMVEEDLISFTIDGVSYQAEEGMTWDEWVSSSYNTDNYGVIYDGLISPKGDHLMGWVSYSNIRVTSVYAIVPDRAYYVQPYSSGGSN